jgi:hypothetical protein
MRPSGIVALAFLALGPPLSSACPGSSPAQARPPVHLRRRLLGQFARQLRSSADARRPGAGGRDRRVPGRHLQLQPEPQGNLQFAQWGRNLALTSGCGTDGVPTFRGQCLLSTQSGQCILQR